MHVFALLCIEIRSKVLEHVILFSAISLATIIVNPNRTEETIKVFSGQRICAMILHV